MTGSTNGLLARLMRVACALYPRGFRSLLAADMAALFAREYRRIEARSGRGAARRYALFTLLSTIAGALGARLHRVHPPRIQMETVIQDVRFAARSLAKNPGFTLVAALSLVLGIGANAAIFSVVNAVLVDPLPYPEADRLVVVYERNAQLGVERTGPSGPTFLDWRERASSFETMALFQPGSATITDLAEPEQVPGMRVTVNFLPLLGYQPETGRAFRPEEGAGGRHDVAIVSRGFARRAWGGDGDVVGRRMMGDHIPYTVVGVLPENFWFPLRADLFVPWDEAELQAQERDAREYAVLARLAPGVTLEQARAEMSTVAEQLAAEHPEMLGWTVGVVAAREEITGDIAPALLVLLGAVAFVLLIACANVANLLLARGASRGREIAIRAATGASRARLLRQLLTESLMLALLGGLGGVALGRLGLVGLHAVLPGEIPLPGGNAVIQLPTVAMDPTVLAFAAVVALATGVACGIVPALQLSLLDLAGVLRSSDRGTGDSGSGRARNLLVVAELALAVVLLVGAGLMLQTFRNLSAVQPGFVADGVLTLQMELPTDSRYGSDDEQAIFYRQVLGAMGRIAGAESVGISEVLPLDNASRRIDFVFDDAVSTDPEAGLGADYNIVDRGFFETLRVPLVAGRHFAPEDDREHPGVVMVDQAFAEAYLLDGDVIGRQIVAWDVPFEIVGMVGAIRSGGLAQQPRPTIYFHYLQAPDNMMSFVLRGRGDVAALTAAAKESVWEVDPEQPIFNVRTLDAVVGGGAASHRSTLMLLSLFGALAAVMAALGVYGVMSYAVGQRTSEIGLRQALGADAGRLVAMVIRDGLVLALAGVALGVIAALGLSRSLSSMLYGVSPTHPLAFVVVAAGILAVALLATLLPARRAARVDPLQALRGN